MKRKTVDGAVDKVQKKTKRSVFTILQIKRYTFQRQGLIDRFSAKNSTELLNLSGPIYPLHATANTTPYLQVFCRVTDFHWKDLAELLHSNPTKLTLQRCMRGTLHIFPAKYLNWINAVYGIDENDDFKTKNKNSLKSHLKKEDVEAMSDPILETIKKNGPQTTQTIKKFLDKKLIKEVVVGKDYKENTLKTALKALWSSGKLEYGALDLKNVKSWQDSNRKYRLSTLKIEKMEFDAAIEEICRWYITTYGPVSLNDWIWWCGLPAGKCKQTFIDLSQECEEIEVKGISYKLFIDKKQLDELEKTPNDEFKCVRFLPYEDSMVKGYKESRWRFFDETLEKKVITRGGELKPSVWINGTPAGTFHINNKQKVFTISLFDDKIKEIVQKELDLLMRWSSFKEYKFSNETQEDDEDQEE